MEKKTFSMIKPRAVQEGHTGNILAMIIEKNFKIIAMKLTQLTVDDAKKFYSVHSNEPFFEELIKFIANRPIIVLILEKDNAVEDFRKLIGKTNPKEAEEGTIRKKYANSITENAIHGSDSDENAKIESSFYFSIREIFSH
jgi:nucleoside-diphosphate kinase